MSCEDVERQVLRLAVPVGTTYGCGSAPDFDRLSPTTDVMVVALPRGNA
jgi:hypothetical protein